MPLSAPRTWLRDAPRRLTGQELSRHICPGYRTHSREVRRVGHASDSKSSALKQPTHESVARASDHRDAHPDGLVCSGATTKGHWIKTDIHLVVGGEIFCIFLRKTVEGNPLGINISITEGPNKRLLNIGVVERPMFK